MGVTSACVPLGWNDATGVALLEHGKTVETKSRELTALGAWVDVRQAHWSCMVQLLEVLSQHRSCERAGDQWLATEIGPILYKRVYGLVRSKERLELVVQFLCLV